MTAEKRQPWMKWFPADWRGDPRLRMSTLAARGLWADLIAYMHEGEPYGHLTIDGIAPDLAGIAALVGRPVAEVRKALAELEQRNVFSRTDAGTIYSRRMVRDKAKQDRDRANGKGGGNPTLKPPDNPKAGEGVNPPDKAQKPEARDQNSSSLRSEEPPVAPKGGEVDLLGDVDRDKARALGQAHAAEDRALKADFADWYAQYPRKEARAKAEKAYIAARRKGASHADLLAGAMRYAAARAGEDPQYTAHPASWLNAGRWQDEPAYGGTNGQSAGDRHHGRLNPETTAALEFLGRQHG